VLPKKATLDREPHAGVVFGRLSALFKQKWTVDLLDVDATVLDCLGVMAISRIFLIATSGSAKVLGASRHNQSQIGTKKVADISATFCCST
jgi:hypothetical protein